MKKLILLNGLHDPVVFVANALSPSKVLDVIVNEEEKATTVIVPDYQLSLAIGKRGQNARLAANLRVGKLILNLKPMHVKRGFIRVKNHY